MGGCAALVLAGGGGSRFGGDTPKQYLGLDGRAVIRHAVDTFLDHPAVDAVRVVLRPSDRPLYDAAMAGARPMAPVDGGKTRQDSARLGLLSLADMAPDTVLIHDGARPFPGAAVIDRVVAALADYPAAIPALPVADTLKRGDAAGATVAGTVERAGLWRAQTPQGFRYGDILDAHRRAEGKALTDDAMIAEEAGLTVAMVAGAEDNLKITTSDDLARARSIMNDPMGATRIGFGVDVHAFGAGDHVTLCGVRIPHDRGLEGHSDADAGLHALTDAVLGAIGDGDIGSHFPPSDDRWRDAASDIFLAHAVGLVRAAGGAVDNVDVTLICEQPKIAPHRNAMRARIAEIMGLPVERVSVKATTTEGLGFTGRGEGIAANAVAAVRLPAR